MDDLPSQIANLQAEFQRIADLHRWVTLAMPPWGRVGIPTIGELVPPPPPPPSNPPGKILDSFGQPIARSVTSLDEKVAYAKATGSIRFIDEHGRDRDASIDEFAREIKKLEYMNSSDGMLERYGPPPWVIPPENRQRFQITEHVAALTWKVENLLLRILDRPNQIPADMQEQIRARKKECDWYGWICWLRYSVVISGPHTRIENYPQVAATALMQLRDFVGADMKAPEAIAADQPGLPTDAHVGYGKPQNVKGKRGRKLETDLDQDKRIYEGWKASGYRTVEEYATKQDLKEREVKLALDRHKKRLKGAKDK